MPLNRRRRQGGGLHGKGKAAQQQTDAGAGRKACCILRFRCRVLRAVMVLGQNRMRISMLCWLHMLRRGQNHAVMPAILRHAMSKRDQWRQHQCYSKKQCHHATRHVARIGQGAGIVHGHPYFRIALLFLRKDFNLGPAVCLFFARIFLGEGQRNKVASCD